jgi:alkylated DNA repair dioxygenase AlkB
MHVDPHAMAAALTKLRPGVTVDVHKLTTDGRSWVLFSRRFWPSSVTDFEQTWATHPPNKPTGKMYGKPVTFQRYQQSYGYDYKFTGQVAAAVPLTAVPAPAAPVLNALRSVEAAAEPQNSALFNFYDGGSDYMGAHSDKEAQLHRGAPILSLSWCHPRTHQRRFRLLPKNGARGTCVPPAWRVGSLKGATVVLGDGDLIVMGGACQTTHKHEVMQARSKELSEQHGRRINITVRSFADASAAVTTTAPTPAPTPASMPAPAPAPTPALASTAWRQVQPQVVGAAAGRDACLGARVSSTASTLTAAGAAASGEPMLGRGGREDGVSAAGSGRRDGPAEGVGAEGVGAEGVGAEGEGAEGVQLACAACTFLNSALLPRCELCDAARTTNPPPSPNAGAAGLAMRRGATGSPRKRARPSAGKETKQAAKAAHNRQVDRTNPSIRNFFSAVQ